MVTNIEPTNLQPYRMREALWMSGLLSSTFNFAESRKKNNSTLDNAPGAGEQEPVIEELL